MFCEKCGTQLVDGAKHCSNCGAPVGGQSTQNANPVNNNGGEQKSKLVAGLLGIFIGSLGVHNFYLGNTRNGIIQLVLCLAGVLTCGITSFAAMIWGLVEGIMIIAGKVETDANGVPLKE